MAASFADPVETARLTERNAGGVVHEVAAAAPVMLDRAEIVLQTATLYVSNDGASWTGTGGPVGFSPDTNEFGGPITSAGLAGEPFRDRLQDVSGGDIVTFVIAAENRAPRAAAQGIVLRNLLPDGFVLPAAGADVSVTDGAGNLVAFTGDLFDAQGGLAIDPAVSLAPYDPDSGRNLLLVTFTLQVADHVVTPQSLHSTAQLVQVGLAAGTATATTEIATARPGLTVLSAPTAVPLGGTARLDLAITLTPGEVRDLRLDEILPPGFALDRAEVLSVGSNLSVRPGATAMGSLVIGTVYDVPDSVADGRDILTVGLTLRAVAPGSGAVQPVCRRRTPASPGARWATSVTAPLTVLAPALSLVLTAPAQAQTGEVVSVTAQLRNAAGGATGYSVHLADLLPAGLVLQPGSAASLDQVQINPGEVVTLGVRAQVTAAAGTVLGVSAQAAASGVADPGAASTGASAAAVIRVTAPEITVAPVGNAAPRIAETALFRITVTVPEGANPALTVRDLLPAGFLYVPGSASVVSVGSWLGTLAPVVTASGRTIDLGFGAVTAAPAGNAAGTVEARQIVVQVQGRVQDGAALGPAVNSATASTGYSATSASTAVTVANTPPQVSGLDAVTAVRDDQMARPFHGVSVQDPDGSGQQMQTATVIVSDPSHGSLTDLGGGTYDAGSGTYRITATTAGVAAALGGLGFLPVQHLSSFGQAVQTGLSLTVTDAAGGLAAASVVVAAAGSNNAPTIAGAWAGQETTTRIAILPFNNLTFADPDAGQVGMLTVRLSDPSCGVVTGATQADPAGGTYTLRGTMAEMQDAARRLVFVPAASGAMRFELTLDDGAGGVATDRSTTLAIAPSADTAGIAEHFAPSPTATFLTATTGGPTLARGEVYQGPVDTLRSQFIYDGGGSVVIVAAAPDAFIKSFSGFAAIQLSAGRNVVDAGPGSNFLIGGTGPDTFFLDGTHGDVVWDTIVGFSPGDMVTLFGFHPGISSYLWEDNAGTGGYTGRTMRADLSGAGHTTASLTFVGTGAADTGRYVISTGHIGSVDYLAIVNPG